MKRLQIVALCVGIFTIALFGINQAAILFHKAETAHLIQTLFTWHAMSWKAGISAFNAIWNLSADQWITGFQNLGWVILWLAVVTVSLKVRKAIGWWL